MGMIQSKILGDFVVVVVVFFVCVLLLFFLFDFYSKPVACCWHCLATNIKLAVSALQAQSFSNCRPSFVCRQHLYLKDWFKIF